MAVNNKQEQEPLAPLKIKLVSVLAHYGWKEDFRLVQDAIAYVNGISLTVSDLETPLEFIMARVEYDTGEELRAHFKTKERMVLWLNQCESQAA